MPRKTRTCNDVIMSAMASQIQPHDCLLNQLFRHRSKKTSKLRVTGFCEGNSPVTGEFPTQRASNAENVSIWCRHHDTVNVVYNHKGPFVTAAWHYLIIYWCNKLPVPFGCISIRTVYPMRYVPGFMVGCNILDKLWILHRSLCRTVLTNIFHGHMGKYHNIFSNVWRHHLRQL